METGNQSIEIRPHDKPIKTIEDALKLANKLKEEQSAWTTIPDVIDFSNDVSMVMLKPTTPTDKEFECKNLSYTEYYGDAFTVVAILLLVPEILE